MSVLSRIKLRYEKLRAEESTTEDGVPVKQPGVHTKCAGRGYNRNYVGKAEPLLMFCTCEQAKELKRMLDKATHEGEQAAYKAVRQRLRTNRSVKKFVEEEIKKS